MDQVLLVNNLQQDQYLGVVRKAKLQCSHSSNSSSNLSRTNLVLMDSKEDLGNRLNNLQVFLDKTQANSPNLPYSGMHKANLEHSNKLNCQAIQLLASQASLGYRNLKLNHLDYNSSNLSSPVSLVNLVFLQLVNQYLARYLKHRLVEHLEDSQVEVSINLKLSKLSLVLTSQHLDFLED